MAYFFELKKNICLYFWIKCTQRKEFLDMPKWEPLKNKPNIYRYKNNGDKKYKYGVRKTYQLDGQKRKEFTQSGFESRGDAEAVLNKFNMDLYSGRLKADQKSNMTIQECYYEIRKLKFESGKWRKITMTTHDQTFKSHIKEHFGKNKLKQIDRSSYQKYLNALANKGLAKNTILGVNSLMQLIMNYAEYNDYVVKNRIKRIDLPEAKGPKDMTIEKEDYDKWLKTAQDMLPEYYYAIVRLVTLGERRSEVLGLQYDSFELLNSPDGQRRYKITFKTGRNPAEDNAKLKTRSSYRSIVTSPEFSKYVDIIIDESKKIRLKKHQSIKPDDYVVVTYRHGAPMIPTYLNIIFANVSKACGINIHPHKLRHYFATIAREESGLSDISVMNWLGHSKIDMTNRYVRSNMATMLNVANELSDKI